MRSSQNRLNGATRHRQASDIHPAQNGKAPKLPFSSNASNSACLVLKNSISISRNWWPQYFVIKISFKLRSGVPKPKKNLLCSQTFPVVQSCSSGFNNRAAGNLWTKIWIWINSMIQFPVLSLDEHSLKSDKENTPRLEWNMPTQAQSLDHIGIPIYYLFRIQKQSWLNNLF